MDESSLYYTTSTSSAADNGIGLFGGLIYLAVIVFMIAAMWKLYKKASKPGWAAIVPIYSSVVMLEIVGRPIWWILLFFIPIVNIVVAVIVLNDLSKSFGRGVGTTLLLLLLPFIGLPMLAFGSATYQGPSVSPATGPAKA